MSSVSSYDDKLNPQTNKGGGVDAPLPLPFVAIFEEKCMFLSFLDVKTGQIVDKKLQSVCLCHSLHVKHQNYQFSRHIHVDNF